MAAIEYKHLEFIPRFHYYLREITQFGDFETNEESKILFIARDKQELIDLCSENNWPCPDCCNSSSGWYTHIIEYRGMV